MERGRGREVGLGQDSIRQTGGDLRRQHEPGLGEETVRLDGPHLRKADGAQRLCFLPPVTPQVPWGGLWPEADAVSRCPGPTQ